MFTYKYLFSTRNLNCPSDLGLLLLGNFLLLQYFELFSPAQVPDSGSLQEIFARRGLIPNLIRVSTCSGAVLPGPRKKKIEDKDIFQCFGSASELDPYAAASWSHIRIRKTDSNSGG